MKEFDTLQELWKQQKQNPLPDVTIIITKAKKEKQSMANKIIIQVATLLLAVVAIIMVVAAIDFKMATTYIGVGLMFLTIIAFSAIRLYQMYRLRNIDLTQNPKEVLSELETFYAFQQFVNTKCTLAYFILLNIAFGFYFIEVMQPMSTMTKAIVLAVYIAWMLIAYFYLGKKQKEKEHARTKTIIDSIKKIEKEYEQ
ncbi:hypothetical protein [Flavobacterium saliperosum]|uniref:Uncharacterized protein n=1 Tax=Flavobacterium saliperosum TaxID=329186 RepID=A0A1G4VMJ2_9FLAO|nr:hypothetical protein [Flavobacterium saliperosum]SCX09020.1 hypothetical protein SAMN02927925_01310 [Flavobacterium saliperosum]